MGASGSVVQCQFDTQAKMLLALPPWRRHLYLVNVRKVDDPVFLAVRIRTIRPAADSRRNSLAGSAFRIARTNRSPKSSMVGVPNTRRNKLMECLPRAIHIEEGEADVQRCRDLSRMACARPGKLSCRVDGHPRNRSSRQRHENRRTAASRRPDWLWVRLAFPPSRRGRSVPDARLVALCDLDQERLARPRNWSMAWRLTRVPRAV